jgi:hypothetical protein
MTRINRILINFKIPLIPETKGKEKDKMADNFGKKWTKNYKENGRRIEEMALGFRQGILL